MRIPSAITAWLIVATSCAAFTAAAAPPLPTTLDDEGVQTWIGRYLLTSGWIVLAADDMSVSLGRSSGVTVTGDGILHADIRREYFGPPHLGPLDTQSNLQSWSVDCKARTFAVSKMQIFTLNNLEGESRTREMPEAKFAPPSNGSTNVRLIDRICRAPSEGHLIR